MSTSPHEHRWSFDRVVCMTCGAQKAKPAPAPVIKIAANGCQTTRAGKHAWADQCLVCGYFADAHPDDHHAPQTTKACIVCGRIRAALSLYPGQA